MDNRPIRSRIISVTNDLLKIEHSLDTQWLSQAEKLVASDWLAAIRGNADRMISNLNRTEI